MGYSTPLVLTELPLPLTVVGLLGGLGPPKSASWEVD